MPVLKGRIKFLSIQISTACEGVQASSGAVTPEKHPHCSRMRLSVEESVIQKNALTCRCGV